MVQRRRRAKRKLTELKVQKWLPLRVLVTQTRHIRDKNERPEGQLFLLITKFIVTYIFSVSQMLPSVYTKMSK